MYDHIGLRVKDLNASLRFCEAVLAGLGHVDASRTDHSPTYYAAFLIDLDGNNVEAVRLTKEK